MFIEDIKKVAFSNAPCLFNINWGKMKLQQMRIFFMSDYNRNAFALIFLKFRVLTNLGLHHGIPILRMEKKKIMIANR